MGEYPGFYTGLRSQEHTIRVESITCQNDPIFHGGTSGTSPGQFSEDSNFDRYTRSAIVWKYLEDIGVPNVTGVWIPRITSGTNLRIQIDKIYRGHAKQAAAAVWGNKNAHMGKNTIVVDKDIDIFDDEAIEWALAFRVNAGMGDIQFFSGTVGSSLDPSIPITERDTIKYGEGKWTRVFIDATVNWDLEPQEQYGGKREPPLCTKTPPHIAELVNRRWSEYGF